MRIAAAVFAACLFAAPPVQALANAQTDLELVLAVDVSRSMDIEEQLLQRKGYAEAFRSREVVDAITGGGTGQIAVTYMEWAGSGLNRVIVPWTVIDSLQSASAFADLLELQQPQRLSRTSITGALQASQLLLGTSGTQPMRQVIDVSGDGPNNQGGLVTTIRDELVAQGVVINGLPLMVRSSGSGFGFGIDRLDAYYFDCVIGGPGAFVVPVYSWEEFPAAVRKKLVQEIVGIEPDAVLIPVQTTPGAYDDPTRAPSDCLIGEKLWEERMRRME